MVQQNLSKLSKLKILSLQSNRITKIEGLDQLVSLEELYLSHNGVERLEGLENNVGFLVNCFRRAVLFILLQKSLRTLDLGANFIPAIENISHLISLEELWVCVSGCNETQTHFLVSSITTRFLTCGPLNPSSRTWPPLKQSIWKAILVNRPKVQITDGR